MKTILLADDSITIQKVVELTFSEADYRVVCVSTGAQALKKIDEERPDLILLDVIMPEKNGYEVCEQVKRSPATSGIPVLLLTGTFEPFDKKRAETVRADGHITKPFESQALIAKVEELIAARPRIAADDQGGRMDIISGGEVYRVDPGKTGESMRPAAPVPIAAPAGPSSEFLSPAEAAAMPRPDRPAAPAGESPAVTSIHPALAPPDPAAGGSFVGFADMGLDAEIDAIVPDRFDEGGGSPSTMRVKRDSVVPRGPSPAPDAAFSGFESEFDLVDEDPAPASAAPPAPAAPGAADTDGWAPPPEAPPAETWQMGEDETPEMTAPPGPATPVAPLSARMPSPAPAPAMPAARATSPSPAASFTRPEGRADGAAPGLTPEMIDLIAEKVVERLADRVVREVAWEVVPGVAETLVRKRIRELEESGS